MILGFVDPYVLACPEDLRDENNLLSYVNRLIAWRDLRETGWLQMLIPSSAPEALANTNGFPPWKSLTDVLAQKDLGIQASDVYEVLNALLNKCPAVEDVVGITELLWDQFNADPEYWKSRRAEHQTEFQRLLGMIALFHTEGGIKAGNRQLITASSPCPHDLSFKATIVDVDYQDKDKLHPGLPINIQDRLTGVCCPLVATMSADYLALWEDARSDEELRASLELSIAQFEVSERVKAGPWKIGTRFFESVRRMHLHTKAEGLRVLRACRETIFARNLEATHAIRESVAGNSAQLKRGTDGAMRRDIDRELHLHYWNTSNGPELAAVVAHNDFTIPE